MAQVTIETAFGPAQPSSGPLPQSKDTLRQALFRETRRETATRWLLGTAYACHPSRIRDLPALLTYSAIDLVCGGTRVPSQLRTHDRPDTFGGLCRDLSPATIVAAARLGFYPWCHVGPLKWWTRRERMVLKLPEHHIAKRFRGLMRKSDYTVTFDTAFDDVIKACAEPRTNRVHSLTWITPRIMRLYAELHDQGYAHSIEVWDKNGRLVGGSYGLAVGRVFITESQFFREPNASKMGFHLLNQQLAAWGFVLNDNKGWTEATAAMGFRLVPRAEYEALLAEHAAAEGDRLGPWRPELTLAEVATATPPVARP